MTAITPVTREAATDAQRAVFDRIEQHFGRPLTAVTVTAHNQAVLDAVLAFERAIARADRLGDRINHLVNLKVAALLGCPFCIDIGSHLARKAGLSSAALRDLPNYRESGEFTDAERAALEVAEAMTLGDGELDATLWLKLRDRFDDGQLVELFAVVAWENYRSRFNRAAGLQAAGFCTVADRAASEAAPTCNHRS